MNARDHTLMRYGLFAALLSLVGCYGEMPAPVATPVEDAAASEPASTGDTSPGDGDEPTPADVASAVEDLDPPLEGHVEVRCDHDDGNAGQTAAIGQDGAVEQLVLPTRIGCSPVTDKTVRALAKLPKLEKLWLHDLPITDASVEVLSGMKGLGELHLYATRVTPQGALRLKAALPGCKLLHETFPG